MPPTSNPYFSEPAIPVLAHSLLPLSKSPAEYQDTEIVSVSESETGVWDLNPHIENGFRSSSNGVFRYGAIIGFSKLRGRSAENNDDEYIGELPRYLLTKWLCRVSSIHTSRTRAYIVHPANFDAFSPSKLLGSLLSAPRQPALSRNEAISYLDSVRLFPVLDFATAVQAINEVCETLHAVWETRQPNQAEQTPETDDSAMLIIVGLDYLTEAVIRASNAVRGAAVLTTALRTVAQLSRMHRTYLSVMFVNTSGVGPIVYETSGSPQNSRGGGDAIQHGRDDGVHSAFRMSEAPLFPSLLMKTLEQGIDTHLLLSNSRSVPVLEVIKDRVGNSLGMWCALDSHK